MELVYHCIDCDKFFYKESAEGELFSECPHCGSKIAMSTQTPKHWYSVQTNEGKAEFKQRIRTERTREFVEEQQQICQLQQQQKERREKRKQLSFLEKQLRLNSFLLTTGVSFEGYEIVEYIDVLFDEILVGLGFGKSIISSLDNFVSALSGSEATTMIDKLNEVKGLLKKRLIQKAVDLGANAILGIDFESSKIGDLIMVSMTGTAVFIQKKEPINNHADNHIDL